MPKTPSEILPGDAVNNNLISQSLTAFEKFPPQQYWRLFVDAAMAVPENGIARFENREPGCINGMMAGFSHMLSNIEQPKLTTDFIKSIAQHCTQGVDNFKNKSVSSGKTRSIETFFYLSLGAVSRDGLIQFINNFKQACQTNTGHMTCGSFTLRIADSTFMSLNSVGYYAVEGRIGNIDNSIQSKYKGVEKLKRKFPEYKDIEAKDISSEQIADMLLQRSNELITAKKTKDPFLYTPPDSQFVEIVLQIITSSYNEKIAKAKTADEKLSVIAEHIQRYELLHPFEDGNGRTFVNCLMNWMLIRGGFPPAILEEPNVFDCFSVAEIAEKIRIGIEATKTLLDNPDANIHGFCQKQFYADHYRLFQSGMDMMSAALSAAVSKLKQPELKTPSDSVDTNHPLEEPEKYKSMIFDSSNFAEVVKDAEMLKKEKYYLLHNVQATLTSHELLQNDLFSGKLATHYLGDEVQSSSTLKQFETDVKKASFFNQVHRQDFFQNKAIRLYGLCHELQSTEELDILRALARTMALKTMSEINSALEQGLRLPPNPSNEQYSKPADRVLDQNKVAQFYLFLSTFDLATDFQKDIHELVKPIFESRKNQSLDNNDVAFFSIFIKEFRELDWPQEEKNQYALKVYEKIKGDLLNENSKPTQADIKNFLHVADYLSIDKNNIRTTLMHWLNQIDPFSNMPTPDEVLSKIQEVIPMTNENKDLYQLFFEKTPTQSVESDLLQEVQKFLHQSYKSTFQQKMSEFASPEDSSDAARPSKT